MSSYEEIVEAAFNDEMSKIAGDETPKSTLGQLVDGLTGGADRRVKRAMNKIDGKTSTVGKIANHGNDTNDLISKYENM